MMFETQMRVKMATAAIRSTTAQRSVISAVSHAYSAGSGCKEVKPWNAHLRHMTYLRLKAQGDID